MTIRWPLPQLCASRANDLAGRPVGAKGVIPHDGRLECQSSQQHSHRQGSARPSRREIDVEDWNEPRPGPRSTTRCGKNSPCTGPSESGPMTPPTSSNAASTSQTCLPLWLSGATVPVAGSARSSCTKAGELAFLRGSAVMRPYHHRTIATPSQSTGANTMNWWPTRSGGSGEAVLDRQCDQIDPRKACLPGFQRPRAGKIPPDRLHRPSPPRCRQVIKAENSQRQKADRRARQAWQPLSPRATRTVCGGAADRQDHQAQGGQPHADQVAEIPDDQQTGNGGDVPGG